MEEKLLYNNEQINRLIKIAENIVEYSDEVVSMLRNLNKEQGSNEVFDPWISMSKEDKIADIKEEIKDIHFLLDFICDTLDN